MEKKGKIAIGLLTAALILIGIIAFVGFHQAAKWQESVRKEILQLDWAVPLGHYDSLGGWVAFKDGEPYFPYAVKETDDYREKMIDKKGRIYDKDELVFDSNVEAEDSYEMQRKEEGYLFPADAYWSDDWDHDQIVCGAKLLQSDEILFETDQFCNIDEIGAGYYQASPVERYYTNDVKVILKNDVTPAFGGSVFLLIGGYSESLCYCEKIVNGDMDNVPLHMEVEKGYYNQNGRLVIPTGDSVYGTEFFEGYAVVYEEEAFYIIDKKGNKVLEKPLRKAIIQNQSGDAVFENLPHWKDRFVIFDGKYYGVLAADGSWLIKPMFYNLIANSKSFFTVYFGDQKGIVELREE